MISETSERSIRPRDVGLPLSRLTTHSGGEMLNIGPIDVGQILCLVAEIWKKISSWLALRRYFFRNPMLCRTTIEAHSWDGR